eukprot:CAMPEP_0181346296 /NCGR_PEP_ID=MMETSP1101-20121128/33252_1 /TAXON_ID=46948 /ORGANISM="Rhodomonas abbreviata, Strain Caron Lab Isolate" /LENGTH=236 /DNA_ID=CAMNT_0023458399 /DNA_START=136 /DNA_END=842 /DNA_ORIENTATION=+
MSAASVASGQQRGGNVQTSFVGLIDSKAYCDRLIQACRAITGKTEQKLLHRESVFRLATSASAAPPAKPLQYELRLRLGKTTSSDSEKFVQPMSLICYGETLPVHPSTDRVFRPEDSKRRLPKPSLRRVVEVEVGHTCDEFLKLFGFDVDYIFIRSGQQFICGTNDRCTIMISEIHQLHAQQQTPKLEKDAAGKPVDNVYLVEVLAVSADETAASVEVAVRDVLALADKLSPYVTL